MNKAWVLIPCSVVCLNVASIASATALPVKRSDVLAEELPGAKVIPVSSSLVESGPGAITLGSIYVGYVAENVIIEDVFRSPPPTTVSEQPLPVTEAIHPPAPSTKSWVFGKPGFLLAENCKSGP